MHRDEVSLSVRISEIGSILSLNKTEHIVVESPVLQSSLTKPRHKSPIGYHRESLKSKNTPAQIPGVTLKRVKLT